MPIKKSFVSLVILLFSQPSFALSFDQFGLGYGILNSGVLTESVSSSGQTSIYGSFTFNFVTAHIRWKTENYKYGLRLGYTLLPRKAEDDAAEITQFLITPQWGIILGTQGKWVWNNGIGFLHTQSEGQGGSVELNNGTTTATFYRPSNTVSSLVMNIESGVQFNFTPTWSVSGDMLINSILGDKRNLSLFFSIAYSWGGSDYGRSSFGGRY